MRRLLHRTSFVLLFTVIAGCTGPYQSGDGAETGGDTVERDTGSRDATSPPPDAEGADTTNGKRQDAWPGDGSDAPADSAPTDDTDPPPDDANDNCTPDCTNKDCGPDGCGGSCGVCASGTTCNRNQRCVCQPDCMNKSCGGDGCGGSCGTCSSGKICRNHQCNKPSFSNDVMALINKYGCAGSYCHGSRTPQKNLELTSTQTAYSNLVGVDAQECANRKRVEAGAPLNSYLIDKLAGRNMCFGSRMPQGGPYMSPSEIDTIRVWIKNGAPNN